MRHLALAAGLWAVPLAALACPVCARDTAPGAWLLIAGLIAAPYAVGLAVVHSIRAAERGGQP